MARTGPTEGGTFRAIDGSGDGVTLCFIVPVKHPDSAGSYARTLDLLDTTLRSVTGQTDDSFRVVVVLTDPDRPRFEHPSVSYVEVDFPPTREPDSEEERNRVVYRDKGSRVAVGLAHARRYRPEYLMIVDADDFVSRRLVSYVAEHRGPGGWYFPRGLRYSSRTRKLDLVDEFWSYCGTSHVLRSDLLVVHEDLGPAVPKASVLDLLGPDYVTYVLGSHLHFREYAAEQGEPLAPLPFRGGVWHLDTGENVSRQASHGQRGPIWGKDVSDADRLRREFGLPDEERELSEELWLRLQQGRNLTARLVRSMIGDVWRGSNAEE